MKILSQELIDSLSGFVRQWRIDSIEIVATRGILVDLIVELLPIRLQSLDQVLHLEVIHILIVRIGVNQQGCRQLVGMEDRRAFLIFLWISWCAVSPR